MDSSENEKFPIDMSEYHPLVLQLSKPELTKEEITQLKKNIQIARDAIIFFTAYAGAKNLGGHTGGAYDITPEMIISDCLRIGNSSIHPVIFDEAGHRVAIHYLLTCINCFRACSVCSICKKMSPY